MSWSTVSSFKGLENHYILLIEGENYKEKSDCGPAALCGFDEDQTQFHYFGSKDDACWQGLMSNDDESSNS